MPDQNPPVAPPPGNVPFPGAGMTGDGEPPKSLPPTPQVPGAPEEPQKKPYPVPGAEPGKTYPIANPNRPIAEGPSVESIQLKSTLRRVAFIMIGVIILAALVFGGIFIYNKFFKSTEGTYTANQNIPLEENVNQEDLEGDMDKDGLPDKWEVEHGLDPTNPGDAKQDPDLDRLNNTDEYYYKTDPNNPDTDGDGYKDGSEVENGFNPGGEGDLDGSGDNGKIKNLTQFQGKWQGLITGNQYSSPDLMLVLKSDGTLSGQFTFSSYSKELLEKGRMNCEVSGTYDYEKDVNEFIGDLFVKTAYGEESGTYNIHLTGQSNGEINQVSGSWTGGPKKAMPWLVQDRGNFQMQKTESL